MLWLFMEVWQKFLDSVITEIFQISYNNPQKAAHSPLTTGLSIKYEKCGEGQQFY